MEILLLCFESYVLTQFKLSIYLLTFLCYFEKIILYSFVFTTWRRKTICKLSSYFLKIIFELIEAKEWWNIPISTWKISQNIILERAIFHLSSLNLSKSKKKLKSSSHTSQYFKNQAPFAAKKSYSISSSNIEARFGPLPIKIPT